MTSNEKLSLQLEFIKQSEWLKRNPPTNSDIYDLLILLSKAVIELKEEQKQ